MITFPLGLLVGAATLVGSWLLMWHGFKGRGPLDGLGTALLAVPVWFGGSALCLLLIDLARVGFIR